MRTKIAPFLIIFSLIFSFSCKEKKTESAPTEMEEVTPTKMEEVMAIHDEVMPEMKTIGQLISELQPLVDSTEAGQQYAQGIKDLKAAHKSMMDWMAGFGERFDSEEILDGKPLSEEKQKWLLEEESKVNAMKDQVNSSIAQAKALLKKD